jgi:hypothetical protein
MTLLKKNLAQQRKKKPKEPKQIAPLTKSIKTVGKVIVKQIV